MQLSVGAEAGGPGSAWLPRPSAAALLGFALAVSGCAKQVALRLTLVTESCVDAVLGDALASPADGVSSLRFTVTEKGVAGTPIAVDFGAQRLSLPLLPLDVPCRVDVAGLSSSGAVRAFGSSGPFTVSSQTAAASIDLTLVLQTVDAFGEPGPGGAACSQLTKPRAFHAQTLLGDGRVLIYGGLSYPSAPALVDWSLALGMPAQPVPGTSYWDDAEIYDPQSGQFVAAGSFAGTDAGFEAAGPRAFAALVAAKQGSDGGAAVYGGETPGISAGGLVGAAGAARFAPPANWQPALALSAHGHGCLAADAQGHLNLAGGLDVHGAASALGETISTDWPLASLPSLPIPSLAMNGAVEARADQACAGFVGNLTLAQPLLLEAGGFTTDGEGQHVSLLGDLFFYSYQAGSSAFGPLTVAGSGFIRESLSGGARSRAKASALTVQDPTTQVASDAALITGGLGCDTGFDAGCLPTFLDGGSAGQLGAPLSRYFGQVATELVSFPTSQNGNGTVSASISVQPGPNLAPRVDHCAVTLPDGRLLVLGGLGPQIAGGFGTLGDAVTTELPGAAQGSEVVFRPAAHGLLYPRAGMACTALADGAVLVTGGYQTQGPLSGSSQAVTTLRSVEIYRPLPLQTSGP